MLGHASILSTEIYTQVAIRKLKQVHELTHPGARLDRTAPRRRDAGADDERARDELLSSLAAEAAEESESTPTSTPAKTPRSHTGWFLR